LKNRTVTPGGAVKSALTRFFNRGGKEMDPYVVDLGLFEEGRPRLEPGVDGIILPVFDEMPSTVIAYSLSSLEYEKQFKEFSKLMDSADTRANEKARTSSGDEANDSGEPGPIDSRSRSNSRTRDQSSKSSNPPPPTPGSKKDIERRMLMRNKSHVKHTFRDFDEKGQQTCKFVCTTYWATQFHALRQAFLSHSSKDQSGETISSPSALDIEKCFVQSLSSAYSWAVSGGKSGASFARTADGRFVIKCISRTELQMFLDCAPAYFEYLSKAFFHGLPTVLCKIVGVFQIGYHNRVTGKRTMEQVAVMQDIFYGRKISRTFDLKGSLRGRFAPTKRDGSSQQDISDSAGRRRRFDSDASDSADDTVSSDGKGDSDSVYGTRPGPVNQGATLLDGDFLEFTNGRPLPLSDRAKAVFHMSVLNDTLFLSIINVLDYSILVGIDEEKMELVVGLIDFMRQYDILKQMERVGKSLPMVVGSEAPTIIQPPLYKARFTNAMERYFMTVPNKWTTI
jgi:1-phosphatidylinositol-3-phosphate 5-kinase